MWRVIYRRSALEAWQEREFATRHEARSFQLQQRARLWAAVVQRKNAAGQWEG